jgi:hypothetical protein
MRQTRRFSLGGFAAALALAAVLAGPAWAQLVVGPFVAPASFYVIPRDGAIVLSWSAVLNPALVGYNVYRRDTGRAADANVLMNATPIIITSVVDAGADNKGLKNGTSYIYSVKGVFLGSDGKPVEGSATRDVVATAQAPVKGLFTLYDIQTLNPGSAAVDAGNVLTIQGSGADVWDNVDAFSFLAVPVSGDFQITIKVLERPAKVTAATNNSGKVGLQIKTDLTPGSAYAYIFASITRDPEHHFEGRGTVNGSGTNKTFSEGSTINSADATFPVWLRLVRKGSVIQAFIATNAAGTNFQQVGSDQDFGTLPNIVQVGVAATAHADGTYVLGKLDYSSLKIENPS